MEEKELPKKVKFPIIPADAMVELKISGFFINKLQHLLIALCTEIGDKNVMEFYENMRNNKEPKTVEEMSLALLTSLIHGIEEAAKKQDKVTDIELTGEELKAYFEHKKFI